MSVKAPLKVVLCWHMHQPYYRDAESGCYRLPWTYLHGIKDYVDMIALLEANPAAKAVVNFTPTLLEQITDYADQIEGFLQQRTALNDPLLAVLVSERLPQEPSERGDLIRTALRANEKQLIHRFPAYRHLAALANKVLKQPSTLSYLSDQYLADLLVWYHLAWLGETVRRTDERAKRLLARRHGYTLDDRRELLTLIGELLGGVIERYRRLAALNQIELSVTPYAHPIMPLLLDTGSTHEAMPEAPLPERGKYPGGWERTVWHIEEGVRVFENYFGFRPKGVWPSEGAMSEETLAILANAGFHWSAGGESVLRNSLHRSEAGVHGCIHRPYRLKGLPLTCFFRDDGLSDLIGFTYADWHAEDAVNNLIHHLENIAVACKDEPGRVVSIIMDGENAWEYYPENGYHFLACLYQRLAEHPAIDLTTFSHCMEEGIETPSLRHIVAGSWVYGTFSTWIGEAEKNRAWDLLIAAKHTFDRVIAEGRLSPAERHLAERQLAICEGSDWFWWFGDYNPADSVKDFDRLYRLQLTALYHALGVAPPAELERIISIGGGEREAGGVMRRGAEYTTHHGS
jgi:alpha-amylase/alpha-mannosidase (GH57 family)